MIAIDFLPAAVITIVFFAAGIASIFVAAIKNPHFQSRRTVVGLLCFTAAVISATFVLLCCDAASSIRTLTQFDLFYFISIALITALSVVFYRTCAVFFVIVYTAATVVCAVFLFGIFGVQYSGQYITLQQEQENIVCIVDDILLPSTVHASDSKQFVQYMRLELPERLLLPLPQTWSRSYAFVNSIPLDTENEEKLPTFIADTLFNRIVFQCLAFFQDTDIPLMQRVSLEIPVYEFYPVRLKVTEMGLEKIF